MPQTPHIQRLPDLLISLSLDYGPEIMPDWQANFAVSSALGQVDAATDALLFGALRLAEKTADKRGKSAGAEKPGGTPEPSDSPQPA